MLEQRRIDLNIEFKKKRSHNLPLRGETDVCHHDGPFLDSDVHSRVCMARRAKGWRRAGTSRLAFILRATSADFRVGRNSDSHGFLVVLDSQRRKSPRADASTRPVVTPSRNRQVVGGRNCHVRGGKGRLLAIGSAISIFFVIFILAALEMD
jgi:hypothetical protein